MLKRVATAFMVGFKAGNAWLGQEQSSESCMQQKSRIEEPEWTTTDKNHEAILLIPNILSRLVKLLALDIMSISREVIQLSIFRNF